MGAKIQHRWVRRLNELPRVPTPQMIIAGARSIGNTMRTDNHTERSAACWRAMADAYFDEKEESEPKNEDSNFKS